MRYRLGDKAISRVVHPNTELVIEGFQRCANSFAVQAFRSVNDSNQKMRIATHLHSPANVLQALRFKIPSMVLIRDPDEALVSWLALAIQLGKLPEQSLRPENQLKRMQYWTQRYTEFYQQLMPVRASIVINDFKEVVSDFGQCIDQLNQKFQTTFQRFEHTSATEAEIFKRSKVHLSPSVDRDAIKASVQGHYFSSDNASNRTHAQEVYRTFLGR